MLRASLDPAQIPAAEADKSVSTLRGDPRRAVGSRGPPRGHRPGSGVGLGRAGHAARPGRRGRDGTRRLLTAPDGQGARRIRAVRRLRHRGRRDGERHPSTVGIPAVHDMFVTLAPLDNSPGGAGRHRVKVENRGNSVLRADIEATASSDVGEPAERQLTVTVEPRRRGRAGRQRRSCRHPGGPGATSARGDRRAPARGDRPAGRRCGEDGDRQAARATATGGQPNTGPGCGAGCPGSWWPGPTRHRARARAQQRTGCR